MVLDGNMKRFYVKKRIIFFAAILGLLLGGCQKTTFGVKDRLRPNETSLENVPSEGGLASTLLGNRDYRHPIRIQAISINGSQQTLTIGGKRFEVSPFTAIDSSWVTGPEGLFKRHQESPSLLLY